MKKILAVLVALMLLVMSAASAESMISIVDPVVTFNMGDQSEEQNVDLKGFGLNITAGQADQAVALQLDVMIEESKMAGVAVNVVGNKLLFAFDGAETVYSVEIPVDQMSGMPALDPAALNINTDELAEKLMSAIEVDGDTMRIPYTALNDVLESIVPALEGVEIPGADMSGFADAVAQLKESNSGINLEITGDPTAENGAFVIKAIAVQNGEVGDEVFNATIERKDSDVDFKAEVPGQGSVYFSIKAADEGKSHIVLGGEAQGTSGEIGFDLIVGESDAQPRVLDPEGALDVQTLTDEQQQTLITEMMGAAGGLMSLFGGLMGGNAA